MILVLLGTHNNSFARLLSQIELCIEQGIITDEVIVQAGHTKFNSSKMKIFDFIPRDELNQLMDKSRIVITHGGVGSIMTALKLGKKVVAIPRLHQFNEHVNDHQIQIVKNFNDCDYIMGLLDVKDLPNALLDIDKFTPLPYENQHSKITELISDYINNN